ncbi:MAG: hypothetical protein Q7T74_04920, partial [Candidatus Saccharibacteria bacterium]|nr:hypothetical protein [Candidatus Saccharibacteria bacterium]
LGGTATTSAKFAVLGINDARGSQTASLSGNLVLDAASSIQTTQNQSLTLGGGTTGNLTLGRASQNLFLPNFTTNGGLLYTSSTGLLTQLGAGTTGNCLTANTGAAPTWGSCDGAGSVNVWDSANGIITQGNTTQDLLIGGLATASSKFAFTNVNSGTPTLKIFNSNSTQSLNLSHDGTNGIITSSTGTINIGNGAGTVYLDAVLTNDTTNNDGFVRVSDKFFVQAAESTGSVAVLIDNSSTGDLLTASAAGATKFTIGNNGNITATGTLTGLTGLTSSGTITLSAFSTNGGLLYTNASGVLAQSGAGSASQCLMSNGGGAPTWGACDNTASVNAWNTASGALVQGNTTLDLLVGGTSTSSAKFAIIGINDARGSQTATLSGNLVLDTAGSLQTTNGQTLTIGGGTSGNLVIGQSGKNITLPGYTGQNGI